MRTIEEFQKGEQVKCNGEVDTIESFVTPEDKENYDMGYRVNLKEHGTQALGSIEKL